MNYNNRIVTVLLIIVLILAILWFVGIKVNVG
jgi:hypothetical protein